MNKMSEVARILGVELDEEFLLKEDEFGTTYKLTTEGLYDRIEGSEVFYPVADITGLITGRLTIVKKPWVPKPGDDYYYISVHGNSICVFRKAMNGAENDLLNNALGNFFKNKDEAIANKERYAAWLKGKKPDFSWRANNEGND